MDAPRCIVCQQRHWSTQDCPAATTQARKQLAREIITKTVSTVSKSVTVISPKRRRTTPHPDCPVCNARRIKQRQATARWRQRQKAISLHTNLIRANIKPHATTN